MVYVSINNTNSPNKYDACRNDILPAALLTCEQSPFSIKTNSFVASEGKSGDVVVSS
jgi:hypothetical protein